MTPTNAVPIDRIYLAKCWRRDAGSAAVWAFFAATGGVEFWPFLAWIAFGGSIASFALAWLTIRHIERRRS